MSAKQASAGKRAYKLYNRIGATDRDKVQAQILINAEKPEDLDVYGRFVRAEIIFWSRLSSSYEQQEAFETFQTTLLDKNTPKPLLVGACFFIGRCYELGFGTDYNMSMAYAHYRLANKLNPKACVKDVARLQKIMNTEPPKANSATPDKFKYSDANETDTDWEYAENIDDWAKEFERCKKSLANNGFFYPDDPEEINVDDIPLDELGFLPRIDDED